MLSAALAFNLLAIQRSATAQEEDPRLKWFLDDGFGMFIHWGVYSDPAGEWKGRHSGNYAEWLMHNVRIPVEEYEREIAAKFNPVDFDAEEWVRLAKLAGMRYIVITAKHHDGFAMYHSEVSPFNIVDFTPFDRDPMKELAEACAAAGIRLCFYYSQTIDWHHPDGEGNFWDYPDRDSKDFAGYLEEKVFPQVEELLTNYGPIGLMWFDTPGQISREQSRELVELVRSLQPDCLVNSRVGHNQGDYMEMGDNWLPAPGETIHGAWETSATMNHSYGYKKSDTNWKSSTRMIHDLILVVSKGGNYLLNVGPTGRGVIPQPSVERLKDIGEWMDVNNEAIYYTRPWYITLENENVHFTSTPDRSVLYAISLKWPGEKLTLNTVRARSGSKIHMLGRDEPLDWEQNDDALSISIPYEMQNPANRPCEHAWVFRIEALPPAEAPTFAPSGGVFPESSVAVSLDSSEDAAIYYSLEGKDSDTRSQLYQEPIKLDSSTKLRARSFVEGRGLSTPVEHEFWVGYTEPVDVARSDLRPGLFREHFLGYWRRLPDFDQLESVDERVVDSFSVPNEDGFGFRYRGYIWLPQDGRYDFKLRSDDGSKLLIHDITVIDHDGHHAANWPKYGHIFARQGLHPIEIRYFEHHGDQSLHVYYKGPGVADEYTPIPFTELFTNP